MRLLLRLLPILFLIVGCTATSSRPPSAAPLAPLTPVVTEESAAPAYEALARREFDQAATLFRSLAEKVAAPRKQEYLLSAVEAYMNGDRLLEASQLLANLDMKGISVRDRARSRLLDARLALKNRDGVRALTALPRPFAPGVEPAFHSEYHLLRGLAFNQTGKYLEAAREYALRDYFITDPSMQLLNQQSIMEALSKLSEPVLLSLKSSPPPDIFTGWLELARFDKARQTLSSLDKQLHIWGLKYPNHPARRELFTAMRERAQQLNEVPSRIALLLPLTGDLAGAAAAVRDGVMSAHESSDGRGTVQLRTYDTGSDLANLFSAYDQAAQEGAQFVIGPLRKEEVEALVKRGDLPVPLLALNTIDGDDVPPGLFQFGLPPEDEAREAADRAWADGHTHAAVLTPSGPWGTRIAEAFRERWTELGGVVTVSPTYQANENDYSATLRSMLKLDESARRHGQVQRIFGRNVEFVPTRRQDIDFIFIAAYPKQARLLRPQLVFHRAGDLPVYATSHLFTGTLSQEQDRDMDGAIFGDMPSVLGDVQLPALERYNGPLRRLVALGSDAYNVLRFLRLLDAFPEERYEGSTGVLRLDEQQRIRRQLSWARFVDGQPVPLEIESLTPERSKARE